MSKNTVYVETNKVVVGNPQPPPPGHNPVPPTRPVVVTTVTPPTQYRSGGGLFGSIERALQQVGHDVDKVVDDVTHMTTVDRLRPGNIIQINSKLNNKNFRILENGAVDCLGDGGTSCQFTISAGQTPNTIKLRNVAQPSRFLAIINGYLVGYGQGGFDSEFIASITVDGVFATFESAKAPGSHFGVLPSGQLTAPALTNKTSDVSHFRILYVGKAF